ncbi:MAG: hypothetical protein R3C60_09640 [Parvularculaceae bacterium]
MKKRLSACLGLLAFWVVATTSAQACMGVAPFVIEDIKAADVVLVGDVTNYSVEGCQPEEAPSLACYGLIDIDVSETLQGEAREHWTLYWWNSTFGVPEKWELDNPLIIAGRWAKSRGLPLRGPSATVFPSKRPELLQVLQAPCSRPFLLQADQETISQVRGLLIENSGSEDKK